MQIKRIIATVGAAGLLVAGLAPAASAADTTDVTVSGGSLTITNPTVSDFSAVTLNGTASTSTATMDAFDVSDARGTGAGWNVTVQGTQFAEWDGTAYVTGGKTLPLNSLSMPQVTVAKKDSTSSAVPTISTGPYTLDGSGAVKIASAAADGSGMGSYTFSQGGSLSLSIPANAYAKTYRSNVTVSIVSGP